MYFQTCLGTQILYCKTVRKAGERQHFVRYGLVLGILHPAFHVIEHRMLRELEWSLKTT